MRWAMGLETGLEKDCWRGAGWVLVLVLVLRLVLVLMSEARRFAAARRRVGLVSGCLLCQDGHREGEHLG